VNLFQGLYLGEVVLLFLGAITFVVLIVRLTMGKKVQVALFFVCIICIGYPSIKSFQYKDFTVTLANETAELQKNPTDAKTRQEVEKTLAKVESRPAPNAEVSTVIARAQFAIGNEAAAQTNLQKALAADPKAPEALALKEKIGAIQQLDQLTAQVKSNPQNDATKQELKLRIEQASKVPIANQDALAKVARAQAAIGNQQEAAGTAEKVFKINPNSPAALEFEEVGRNSAALGQSRLSCE
jgi:tetratricopeptide (TPR) repeat protein